MPPRPRRTAARRPDPDELLAREHSDPEADALVDAALDDELAAQIAREELGSDTGLDDEEAPTPPAAPPAEKTPPPAATPPVKAAAAAAVADPGKVVLDSPAAPLDPPPVPEPPPPVLPKPRPNPDGDFLGFVDAMGRPLKLADALDLSSPGPIVKVLRPIEIQFRPPGQTTPMQQLKFTAGSYVSRATVQQMLAAEKAVEAASGG
jgi:hypothetical protein